MDDGTVWQDEPNVTFDRQWRSGAFLFLFLMLIGEAALLWWAW